MSDKANEELSQEMKYLGMSMIWLLFKEKVEMPSSEKINKLLTERFKDIDVVSDDKKMKIFALLNHKVTYSEGQQVPSQIMITECDKVLKPHGDEIARTQFWDCPDGIELLDSCPYQIMIGDFMAMGLPAKERADILADWLDVALELFPECVAVYSDASGKLLTAEKARSNPYEGCTRFMWFGVNARFFKIEGTNDMVIDTLGLHVLGIPDVQYHYHDLEPDNLINHGYNVAIYQLENDVPIKSDDTIDGINDEPWICRYEHSLIGPQRPVLDIETGKYASGNRNPK